MQQEKAVEKARSNAFSYGGKWHVVYIDGEYYDVADSWFKFHKGKSFFSVDYNSVPKTLRQRVVIALNKFLQWLLKPLLDASRNSRKT